MNKNKLLIIGAIIIGLGIGTAIGLQQIKSSEPTTAQEESQEENSIEEQKAAIRKQIQEISEEWRQKIQKVFEKQKEEGCVELKEIEMLESETGNKVTEKHWRTVSTEGICGELAEQRQELGQERSRKMKELNKQIDLLTARPEEERERAKESIRKFMARPDLELEYLRTSSPSNFTVGVVTEISEGGYKIETPEEWKRKAEIYQQKEYIGDTCEVYEYEVDIRNNEVVQVGVRYPQEGVIPQPMIHLQDKYNEECQNTRSLEIPILTMPEIEETAMGYLRRGVKNFNEIKDEFVYEGSAKDPKRISAHHAWIWEDKDYELPEGLTAQAPSEVPTIWSRVSCGGHLIMYLNTVGLFEE